jgi:CHASE3 domain sensor protein
LGHETGSGTTQNVGLRFGGRHRVGSDVQVLLGIGSLFALLAVAVGLAVALIVAFEDDATGDARRHALYATAINEAALSAKGIANDYRGYLHSGDSEYLGQIRTRTAEARRSFRVAAGYAAGAPQREAVRESRSGFEIWLHALGGDIAAYRRGSKEEAIQASLGSTRRLRKTYEQSLADAYALGMRSIEASTRSLSSSATRSVTMLFVYLAVALFVGVAIALWVVRAILRPAFALSQSAIEVLNTGYVLVGGGSSGSHHGMSVVVPIEAVNALAESALETQESLGPGNSAA